MLQKEIKKKESESKIHDVREKLKILNDTMHRAQNREDVFADIDHIFDSAR